MCVHVQMWVSVCPCVCACAYVSSAVGAEGISVLSSAAAPSPSHAPLEDQVVGLLTDALYDK